MKQLVLTGLPKLQHLKVCHTLSRSKPKVTVRCKALKLPPSLLTFDLTVSTPELMVQHHLTALGSLRELMSVGLHGPVGMDIPELCTSVKRCVPCPLHALMEGCFEACEQDRRLVIFLLYEKMKINKL